MLEKLGRAGGWAAGSVVVALALLQAFGLVGDVTGITDYVAPHSPIRGEAARGFAEVVFVIAGALTAASRRNKVKAKRDHEQGKLDKPAVMSTETRAKLTAQNPRQVQFNDLHGKLVRDGWHPTAAARAVYGYVYEGLPLPVEAVRSLDG